MGKSLGLLTSGDEMVNQYSDLERQVARWHVKRIGGARAIAARQLPLRQQLPQLPAGQGACCGKVGHQPYTLVLQAQAQNAGAAGHGDGGGQQHFNLFGVCRARAGLPQHAVLKTAIAQRDAPGMFVIAQAA